VNEGFATYAQVLWIEHTEGLVARNHYVAQLYAFHAALNRFQNPEQLATLDASDVIDGYWAFRQRFLGGRVEEGFADRNMAGLGAVTAADLEEIPATDGLTQLAALGVPEATFPGNDPRTGDPGVTNLFAASMVYGRGALTPHAVRLGWEMRRSSRSCAPGQSASTTATRRPRISLRSLRRSGAMRWMPSSRLGSTNHDCRA